jgi:hypothetical protein
MVSNIQILCNFKYLFLHNKLFISVYFNISAKKTITLFLAIALPFYFRSLIKTSNEMSVLNSPYFDIKF